MLKVTPARRGGSPHWIVEHDPQNPPDVFFDTNVWIGMNQQDIANLKRLESNRGFLFRYSVTNYCEIVSHLEDQPSESTPEPFIKYRQCLRKITEVCHREVLPAPEMEFLEMAGLLSYLEPVWIPNIHQTALAIEIISTAETLAEVRRDIPSRLPSGVPRYVVKPNHYRMLRDADGESFRKLMALISDIQPPIRGSDKDKMTKLGRWFLTLANFFFLERTSLKRVSFLQLSQEERDRFVAAFTVGVGRLFHTHCVNIVKKTINNRRNIAPNDLYDAMQLLSLRDDNRLFVTDDRFFYQYEVNPEIQRVIPWSQFKSSG
jgi:hypothetical protein